MRNSRFPFSPAIGDCIVATTFHGVSFSENGAKGNTYMESFNGHFKTESGSLLGDARNTWELRRAIAEQVEYYNVTRRHSALGYVSPWAYIKQEVTLPEQALDLAQISS